MLLPYANGRKNKKYYLRKSAWTYWTYSADKNDLASRLCRIYVPFYKHSQTPGHKSKTMLHLEHTTKRTSFEVQEYYQHQTITKKSFCIMMSGSHARLLDGLLTEY